LTLPLAGANGINVTFFARTLAAASLVLAPASVWAQTLGCVAPGTAPVGEVRRATLHCFRLLQDDGVWTVLSSAELRRALAGIGRDRAGGALAELHTLAQRAQGQGAQAALQQLGHRLGVDLWVSWRGAGQELEVRLYHVGQGAFFRGTLMVPADRAPSSERLLSFLRPRVAEAERLGQGQTTGQRETTQEDRPRSESAAAGPGRRKRWWIWGVVAGVVVAAALAGFLLWPQEEEEALTLRVVVP
jgi:hypothetical protein